MRALGSAGCGGRPEDLGRLLAGTWPGPTLGLLRTH